MPQSYKLHFWNTFPSRKQSKHNNNKGGNIFQKYEKYSPGKIYESELYYFSYLVNPFGIILFPIALFRNVFDSLKELATCTSYIQSCIFYYMYIENFLQKEKNVRNLKMEMDFFMLKYVQINFEIVFIWAIGSFYWD